MLIGLILLSVALAAIAQLTLKHGMNQVAANSGELQLNAHSLKDVAGTLAVWGGLLLFGLSAFVWLAVLSRASLSFAYPVRVAHLCADPARRPLRAARADPAAAMDRRAQHHARHRAGRADPASVTAAAAPVTVAPEAAELAVVIVNFNTGGFLERCLASLERHRGDIALDVLVDRQRISRRVAHRRRRRASVGAARSRTRQRLPLARVEPGHRGDRRPTRAAAEPRCRVVGGHARRLRRRSRRGAPARRHRGPARAQLRRHRSTRAGGRFPSVVDAVGHAFLGSVRPGNPFTRRYQHARAGIARPSVRSTG